MALVGLLSLVMHSTYRRAQNELGREYHRDLMTDKFEVRSALRHSTICDSLPKTCKAGERLDLKDKNGREIVNQSGTNKIGRWNVRVECSAVKRNRYLVYISRMNGAEFLKDPLTKQVLEWKDIDDINSICGTSPPKDSTFLRNDCYGGVEGNSRIPPSVVDYCGKGCPQPKYCTDDQVPFPQCPEGQRMLSQFLDRYGWAGRDLSKYTVCMKVTP